MEIFYLDASQVKSVPDYIYSTLAHEFQHMINFNMKSIKHNKSSAAWYNEMLSMATEDVIGAFIGVGPTHHYHPIQTRIPTFLDYYDQVGVTEWITLGSASYAKGYAFGAYLMRNFGGAKLLEEILKNDKTNIESVTAALDKFEAGLTFEKALERYGEALVFSGARKPSGALSFDNTVGSTINGRVYTAAAFDIWGTFGGPRVFNLSPKEMRGHSVTLHSQSSWQNVSGDLSITLEKPANSDVEMYIMTR